ncbi:MAG: hypothetical protein ABSF44_15815 [Candidatus Bathyarchaeia archaeon]|jgi:hypothetical protein
MVPEKVEFKRVGPPMVTAKIGDDYFVVEITLDGTPDSTWIDCFKHPTNYKSNEAHPSRTTVSLGKITFSSSKSNIETNVEWMDKYIHQANDCYEKKMSEQIAFQNRVLDQAKKQQEEIDKINQSLKDL